MRQRAWREKWKDEQANTLSRIESTGAIVTGSPKVVSRSVIEPHKAMGNALSDQDGPTKLGFAIAARKVAVAASRTPAKRLLVMGSDVRPWQQIAASVHGWDAQQQAGAGVHLTFNCLNVDSVREQPLELPEHTIVPGTSD